MTERLYYTDSYLRDFTARIVDSAARPRLPRPHGLLPDLRRPALRHGLHQRRPPSSTSSTRATASPTASRRPVAAGPVDCAVDWTRRYDHMQQHTGQHLLSAVFEELFGLHTVSFHLGAESATIDVEGAAVDTRVLAETERRVNEIVYENRPVAVRFENAAEAQGLRKPSDREGTLRIVSIDALDRSACGGTHLRATGEIGAVLLRKTEKIRQATRVEFVCGARAVRRAHADYEALSKAAQLFSAPLDEVPASVAAQLESARAAEKAAKKGRNWNWPPITAATSTPRPRPMPDGARRVVTAARPRQPRGAPRRRPELHRAGQGRLPRRPRRSPSVLLATSADSGVDAGQLVKAAVTAAGGRGGGNARMAQGSVPDAQALAAVIEKLTF